MTAPVKFTSPGHSYAYGGYAIMLVLGMAYLTGWAGPNALSVTTSGVVAAAWAVGIGGAGAFGLISIRGVYRATTAEGTLAALRDERMAAVVAAVALLVYEAAIMTRFGPDSVVNAQVLVTGLGLASVARVRQITSETRHLRHALSKPAPADPAPLGEPVDSEG